MEEMDDILNKNTSIKDKIKKFIKSKPFLSILIVGGFAGVATAVLLFPILAIGVIALAGAAWGIAAFYVAYQMIASVIEDVKNDMKAKKEKKILDFDELAKKAEIEIEKKKAKEAKRLKKEAREEKNAKRLHTFCHNYVLRYPIYILMLTLAIILHVPIISFMPIFGIAFHTEDAVNDYRRREKRENKETYKELGKYDEKFIEFCKNIPTRVKKYANKLLEKFNKQTRDKKFSAVLGIETAIYMCLMLATGSQIVLFSFIVAAFTTFGVDIALFVRDLSKKAKEIKKESKTNEDEDSIDAIQSELKEQVKLLSEINKVEDSPTMGSIIRSSKEIAKEKGEYVSLLDLVKKYQREQENKETKYYTPVPTINMEEGKGFSYMKK